MIVRLFKDQFAPLVRDGRKCQTVRPVPKRPQDMPKPGDVISLRRWTGKPYRSKQEVLRESIVVRVHSLRIDAGGICCRYQPEATWHRCAGAESFAHEDGFANFAEMVVWFEAEHGALPFEGIAIYWATEAQLELLRQAVTDGRYTYNPTHRGHSGPEVSVLVGAGLMALQSGALNGGLTYAVTARGRAAFFEWLRSKNCGGSSE